MRFFCKEIQVISEKLFNLYKKEEIILSDLENYLDDLEQIDGYIRDDEEDEDDAEDEK